MHLFVKIQFNRGTFNFFVSLIILKRKQYDLWSIDVRFSETVFSGQNKKEAKNVAYKRVVYYLFKPSNYNVIVDDWFYILHIHDINVENYPQKQILDSWSEGQENIKSSFYGLLELNFYWTFKRKLKRSGTTLNYFIMQFIIWKIILRIEGVEANILTL